MASRVLLPGTLLLFVVATLSAVIAKDLASELPSSLIAYRPPAYPVELKRTSTTDGYSIVAFAIRPDGNIDEAVTLEASHTAFGEAVLQVLPMWRFENARDALPRREVLRFEFRQDGAIVPLSQLDATKAAFPLAANDRLPIRTIQWPKMSTPPERLAGQMPAIKSGRAGQVVVSYVIDTTGRVRIPAVVNATQPELGLAVIEAVKQWRFAPPQHDGLPVLVEDQRSFTFKPAQE